MALISRFSVDLSPDERSWLRSATSAFRVHRGDDWIVLESHFTSLLEDSNASGDDLIGLLSPLTAPRGVYGTGLVRMESSFLPAIFVMPELLALDASESVSDVEMTVRPIAETVLPALLGRVQQETPERAVAIGLPRPIEEYASVAGVSATGTLGLPVWLRDGREGVLTAGHVVRLKGAPAQIDGVVRGQVTYSNNRARSKQPTAVADVASIALLSSADVAYVSGRSPAIAGLGSGGDLMDVEAVTVHGAQRGTVRAVMDRFSIDQQAAWADVLLVDPAISLAGDSGSVVLDEDDHAVGQIVGGHPPTYSLVQDMHLLLKDSGTSFR